MAKLKEKAEEIAKVIEAKNYPVMVVIYTNAGGGILSYEIYRKDK